MKRAILLLLIASFVTTIGCISTKYINAKELGIKEAFMQREVPGQQNGKTLDYLKVSFDLAPGQNIYVDSVSFRGTTTLFNSPARNLRLKLNQDQLNVKSNTNGEKAILYFTKEGKAYRKVIDGISRKSDLFLP